MNQQQLNTDQARVAIVKVASPEYPVLAVEVSLNGAALTIDQGTVASDPRLVELALQLISYVTEKYQNGE